MCFIWVADFEKSIYCLWTQSHCQYLFRWLSDFAFVDSLFVVNCSLVLSAICVFLFPFVNSYAMLLTVGALFGLAIAAYISLTRLQLR